MPIWLQAWMSGITPRPLSTDHTVQDPDAKDPAAEEKLRLQLAIFETVKDAGGKNQREIREMLVSAFARHGVQSPAGTWLDSVASAAFYGEPYIIDLPTAVAADAAVAAPTEDMRQRLATRRRLRKLKLPAGILPSPADWEVPEKDITGGITGGRGRAAAPRLDVGGPWMVLAAVALAAAAVTVVLAARTSSRNLPTGRGHHRQDITGRKGSDG